MNKVVGLALVAIMPVLLNSCGLLERREPVIGTFFDEPQSSVGAPSEVTKGEPFIVSVSTLGGDCTKAGDTLVQVRDLEAEVTPMDVNILRPTGCLLYAETLVHTATLTFDQTGKATVTFYGQNPDYSSLEKFVSVTRTVMVR